MARLLELVDAGTREVGFVVREDCAVQEALRSVGLSRPGAASALARGSVLRDGRALTAGTRLRAGEKIALALVRTREARCGRPRGVTDGGVTARVDVVYEDRFVVAVDKPAGLLVHSDGRDVETLTSRVQALADERGYDCAVQALQRLDVATTGITLFSLTEEFQPAFDELVAGHGMGKRYLLEVAAGFPEGERWIEAPIGRDRHDARRMRVSGTGKPSRTLVRKLGERGGRSLLVAELATGRRHQIRVHLASMGFPLAGDSLYGGAATTSAGGLMLHALEESFVHPVTGARVRVATAWPERFDADFPREVFLPMVHTGEDAD